MVPAVVLQEVQTAEMVYRIPGPLETFASWPAWQREVHLTHCCQFCRDPFTCSPDFASLNVCAGCGQKGCVYCVRGCDDCSEWGGPDCECDQDEVLEYGCHCQRSTPRYCYECHHGPLQEVHCGKVVCARHLKWHDDTAEACAHTGDWRSKGCCDCILHQRKCRDTLVREVERNLLLGSKDRAAPAKDAPKATVLLDRLVRTGQAPMASVVLDFAGGRRNNGPRSRMPRPKLRAKKDTRMKAPRKMLAKMHGPWPEKNRRVVEGRL